MFTYQDQPSQQAQTPSSLTPKGEEDNQKAKREAEAKVDNSVKAVFRNMAFVFENRDKPDSEIKKVLSGQTMRVGFGDATIDTKIPLHPKALSFIVGMGDMMGDTARGVAQILKEQGIADVIDTRQQDENEKILRQLRDDPEFGGSAMAGSVVGAITDPALLLLPAGRFKQGYQAAMYAAATGAVYGSSMYVDQNESRLKNAVVGAALGGPLGYFAHRFFRNTVGSTVDDIVEAERKKLNLTFKGTHAGTGKPHWQLKTEKQKPRVRVKADSAVRSEEVLTDLEVRAALEGQRHSMWQKSKNIIDQAIQPLYDVVKKYHPQVAAKLRNMDGEQHIKGKVWTDRTKKWNDWMDSLPNDVQVMFHKQLSVGLDRHAYKLIEQHGGKEAVGYAREVEKVLKDIMDEYIDAGYLIKPRANYYPTTVRPEGLEFLVARQQSEIDKILAKETKRQGRPLTPNQKSHIMERLVSFDIRYSNTSGSLKKRKIEDVTDEQLQHYFDPVTALHYYISSAAEDIAKRRFFKGFGYKPDPNKGLDVSGADIDKSIDSLIDSIKHQVKGKDAINDLVNNLRSRFSADIHKTHRFVQAIKNSSYAGTLGNWWSAMTQVGDTVFAIHKYGIAASVHSILGKNITTKEGLGIDKAMIELNSARGVTSKVADWAFKWSGFDAVDRFGKNVNINASLRFNRKLATKDPAKFKKKWENNFGDDTDTLINELKTLKMQKDEPLSDNMKLMLWNDLADTQPIGLSEMPKKYLDMPNGRIFYAYKTFTMKQFNYMRQQLNDPTKSGFERGRNLTYFASLFVLANSSIDLFKAFMSGKELDPDDAIFDNVVGMIGTSKYAVDKSRGLGSMVMEGILPVPITQGAKVFDKVGRGDVGLPDVMDQLPIAGKLNRDWDLYR